VALCLTAGLFASVPGISLAEVNYVPQNTSAAPAIPAAALQQFKMLRSADLLFVSTLLSYSFTKAFNAEESSWLLLMLSLLQQP
ncbi:hypothetical protein MJM83_33335, partial [Salmonella enterica subsp. enterica serovar Montevideo]|nr:hypothetical protein [Salmonella enterica subsp. enterica serovar Montevideo]